VRDEARAQPPHSLRRLLATSASDEGEQTTIFQAS